MTIFEIIDKKRAKQQLLKTEIDFFVENFVAGNILPEQASALLMAICIQGMSRTETLLFTQAMAKSGDNIDLSALYENNMNLCVDKHSSGGVSDTTTFIIAGMLASCDVKMLKMSGRSLGFTGGTADKMEEFLGYNNEKSVADAIEIVKKHNVSLITQTNSIVPADKKIYALRDKTGTVESIPLIASSIMSKKLASGSGILLLDVKCGNGAFMKTPSQAKALAKAMVQIGNDAGIKTAAFVTSMNQPLGQTVGNTLEAKEAVDVLKNLKQGRLTTLCIEESSFLVSKAKSISLDRARQLVKQNWNNLKAYKCFEEIVHAHGGTIPNFEIAKHCEILSAKKSGRVSGFETSKIGLLAKDICTLSPNGGLEFAVEIGSKVIKGDTLAKVFAKSKLEAIKHVETLAGLIEISSKSKKQRLIHHVITH